MQKNKMIAALMALAMTASMTACNNANDSSTAPLTKLDSSVSQTDSQVESQDESQDNADSVIVDSKNLPDSGTSETSGESQSMGYSVSSSIGIYELTYSASQLYGVVDIWRQTISCNTLSGILTEIARNGIQAKKLADADPSNTTISDLVYFGIQGTKDAVTEGSEFTEAKVKVGDTEYTVILGDKNSDTEFTYTPSSFVAEDSQAYFIGYAFTGSDGKNYLFPIIGGHDSIGYQLMPYNVEIEIQNAIYLQAPEDDTLKDFKQTVFTDWYKKATEGKQPLTPWRTDEEGNVIFNYGMSTSYGVSEGISSSSGSETNMSVGISGSNSVSESYNTSDNYGTSWSHSMTSDIGRVLEYYYKGGDGADHMITPVTPDLALYTTI